MFNTPPPVSGLIMPTRTAQVGFRPNAAFARPHFAFSSSSRAYMSVLYGEPHG